MEIFYSPQFLHEYKRLPEKIKEQAMKKERIFRKNPFNQQLKTHKLKGKFNEFWAFSIDFQYRIIFKFGTFNSYRI